MALRAREELSIGTVNFDHGALYGEVRVETVLKSQVKTFPCEQPKAQHGSEKTITAAIHQSSGTKLRINDRESSEVWNRGTGTSGKNRVYNSRTMPSTFELASPVN